MEQRCHSLIREDDPERWQLEEVAIILCELREVTSEPHLYFVSNGVYEGHNERCNATNTVEPGCVGFRRSGRLCLHLRRRWQSTCRFKC